MARMLELVKKKSMVNTGEIEEEAPIRHPIPEEKLRELDLVRMDTYLSCRKKSLHSHGSQIIDMMLNRFKLKSKFRIENFVCFSLTCITTFERVQGVATTEGCGY